MAVDKIYVAGHCGMVGANILQTKNYALLKQNVYTVSGNVEQVKK